MHLAVPAGGRVNSRFDRIDLLRVVLHDRRDPGWNRGHRVVLAEATRHRTSTEDGCRRGSRMTEQRVLDVSALPISSVDSRSLIWWGNLGMMAIEGSMFAMTIATFL